MYDRPEACLSVRTGRRRGGVRGTGYGGMEEGGRGVCTCQSRACAAARWAARTHDVSGREDRDALKVVDVVELPLIGGNVYARPIPAPLWEGHPNLLHHLQLGPIVHHQQLPTLHSRRPTCSFRCLNASAHRRRAVAGGRGWAMQDGGRDGTGRDGTANLFGSLLQHLRKLAQKEDGLARPP